MTGLLKSSCVDSAVTFRPQFVMFPGDEVAFSLDDQYYIGSSGLLVKPVTVKGAKEASVYLSDKQVCLLINSQHHSVLIHM